MQYDYLLLFLGGIADDDLQQESVNLSLGERIGSFLFDGVLGSHYEEGFVKGKGLFTDGDLALLHGFEQRALDLGRGTVDLIGQYEVGEDGAFLYLELLFLDAIDHCTCNIGREQVGCKLDAAVFSINYLSKGLDGKGLGKTRHALEKHVAIGKEGDQQGVDEMFLSDNSLVHPLCY